MPPLRNGETGMGKTADQAGIVIYWDTFELLDELEPAASFCGL